jgi:hypothetical protein
MNEAQRGNPWHMSAKQVGNQPTVSCDRYLEPEYKRLKREAEA